MSIRIFLSDADNSAVGMVVIMKFKKILMILAAVLIMASGFVLGSAYAGSTTEPVTAYMCYDVGINYNGENVIMKNADGSRIFPIIYGGTTYIPIRPMGNLFGVPVDWDGTTRTVLLGSSAKTQGTDLINTFKPYAVNGRGTIQYQTSDKKTGTVGGVEVDHWLYMGVPNAMYYDGCLYVYYNIGGKYNSLTFEVASNTDTVLSVYGDNELLLGETDLIANQVPKKVTIPLARSSQLHFQTSSSHWTDYQNVCIINAYLS